MRSELRDELIDVVRYGRMTPDEAEAEAQRLGVGSLASEPETNAYDPMGETWWSLSMVVAWITWRSPEKVRKYWDAYRLECWDWHYRGWQVGPDGPVHKGHFLKQRSPASLLLMSLAKRFDEELPERSTSLHDSQVELWKALGEDIVEATGINVDGSRVPISKYEWRDLQIVQEREREALRPRGGLAGGGYTEVALNRRFVVSVWRAQLEQPPLRLPDLMSPDGPGYMPLYCAVQWIATAGGTIDIDPGDTPAWKHAYAELIARISSEQVNVTGILEGERERIDGFVFASCRVDYPFHDSLDLLLSEELVLRSYPYLDEQHWHGGFDDSLENRWGTKWAKLMVLKSDVARWWPRPAPEPVAEAPPTYRTGAPGRPTSMQLVKIEYEARWGRGEVLNRMVEESKFLSMWLADTHPAAPKLSPKTIRNNLGTDHRRRLAAAQK